MRRTWIGLAMVLLISVVSVGVVDAYMRQFRWTPLNEQVLGLIPNDEMRSSRWLPVDLWAPSDGPGYEATKGIAVTLSVTVSGGPVEFRVAQEVGRRNVQRPMRPGIARFDPGTGTESFSFTFVGNADGTGRQLNLWWRSPTSATVTLHRGTVVMQYGST